MIYEINGYNLNLEVLNNVSRLNCKIKLSHDSIDRIKNCREMVEKKIKNKEIVYGINTGIGEFSEKVLNDNQLEDFQKYLIYNHSAGIGEAAPLDYVRGAMLGRVNVHAKGNSGCRLEITETLIEMLNKQVTPFVCQKGSVGAVEILHQWLKLL